MDIHVRGDESLAGRMMIAREGVGHAGTCLVRVVCLVKRSYLHSAANVLDYSLVK